MEEPMFLEELVVKSSIHVILAQVEDMKPVGFGSGCLIKYRERLFLISVRHVTDAENASTFLETNQPPVNGETPLWGPIGGLCYFDMFRLPNNTKELKIKQFEDLVNNPEEHLDICFAEIKQLGELLQPEVDFGAFKIPAGPKAILIIDDSIVEPSTDEEYAFFGKVRQKLNGKYLMIENTFKHHLKFNKKIGRFHRFLTREIIKDKYDYKGCSGAPILDSQGRIVALACKIAVNTKIVLGFSIKECLSLLDIALDTGML